VPSRAVATNAEVQSGTRPAKEIRHGKEVHQRAKTRIAAPNPTAPLSRAMISASHKRTAAGIVPGGRPNSFCARPISRVRFSHRYPALHSSHRCRPANSGHDFRQPPRKYFIPSVIVLNACASLPPYPQIGQASLSAGIVAMHAGQRRAHFHALQAVCCSTGLGRDQELIECSWESPEACPENRGAIAANGMKILFTSQPS